VPGVLATTISKVSGDNQSGLVSQTVRYPLVVVVTDADAIPVAGVSVTFEATEGDGMISATPVITDDQGVASVILTVGPNPATNTVLATATGLTGSPITFTATGTEPPPPKKVRGQIISQ
jgi:hypothetical protein